MVHLGLSENQPSTQWEIIMFPTMWGPRFIAKLVNITPITSNNYGLYVYDILL